MISFHIKPSHGVNPLEFITFSSAPASISKSYIFLNLKLTAMCSGVFLPSLSLV